MKINFSQFNLRILTPCKPIYCISGDDYILIQEIENSMIHYFEQHSFATLRKQISQTFSCKHLIHELRSLNLFTPQRFFIVSCPNIQWIKSAEAEFKQYMETCHPQTIVLLCLPKLEKAQQNSSWLKLFEQHGIHIQLWPLNDSQFRTWFKKKIIEADLKISEEAFQQLLQHVEGNLGSAVQEINTLKLQFGTQYIHDTDIIQSVALTPQYSVFKVLEHCLLGNTIRLVPQLMSLKNDGIEPLIVLGALTYDLRQLLAATGTTPSEQRQEKYRIALKRQPSADFWWHLLTQAQAIDQRIKSSTGQLMLIWDDLIKIFLSIAYGVHQ